MIRERERQRKFRQDLQRSRPSRKRSRHARALEMPARERSNQVRGAEDVEQSTESAASDAVQR